MTSRRYLESAEQIALFRWAALNERIEPRLRTLYAIPNGGKRNAREAARMKREGVRAGVWDVCLPVMVGNRDSILYGSLYIEMKGPKGKLSAAQSAWREDVVAAGACTAVCRTWIEAANMIRVYLLPDTKLKAVK